MRPPCQRGDHARRCFLQRMPRLRIVGEGDRIRGDAGVGGDGGGGGGGGCGAVSGLTFTVGSTGSCLRKFKYRWRAATYSLTFLSSANVLPRKVIDTSKLCFDFATALVGLCKRLYSLSHSSTSISFLRLHHFRNILPRIDNTGGSRAVRNPPFFGMRHFFVSDVFLIARALTSFLLRRKFAF